MLHVVDEGNGPPVVLLHGLASDLSRWEPVAELLRTDHRCVRVDLPGHGRSPDGGYRILEQVTAVHEVVEHLGLERPALVGHSAGAMTATLYAVLHPVSCVVNVDQPLHLPTFAALVGPPARWHEDFDTAFAELEAAVVTEALPEVVRIELLATLRPRKEVVLAWWEDLLAGRADELQEQLEAALPLISAPYLAVLGAAPSPPARRALDLVPRSVVEVWPGGHFPHLVDPPRFAGRLRELVSGAPRLGGRS